MARIDEAREFFAQDRYAMNTTGIVIDVAEEGYAKCSVKIDDRHLGAHGQIMGGVMYTLADFAFAVATNTKEKFTATCTSTINYLSMAKDDTLIAECKSVKDGRRTVYYETYITDGLENLVAVVTTTGIRMN